MICIFNEHYALDDPAIKIFCSARNDAYISSSLGTSMPASLARLTIEPTMTSTSMGLAASKSTSIEGLKVESGFSFSIMVSAKVSGSSSTSFFASSLCGTERTSSMMPFRYSLDSGVANTSPTVARRSVQTVENDAFLFRHGFRR